MATSFSLVTGNTFVNGDSATATKLNNQVNVATFSSSTASILVGFDGSKNPVDVPYTAFTTTLLATTSATAARTVLVLGSAATSSTGTFCQTANNLSDLNSASTARTNLGLATVASSGAYGDLSGKLITTRIVNFDSVVTATAGLAQQGFDADITAYSYASVPTGMAQCTNDYRILAAYDHDSSTTSNAHFVLTVNPNYFATNPGGTFRVSFILFGS